MTYGASGSGKTFTVIGTDEEPGIVPRFLEYLFRTLPQLSRKPIAKPSPTGEEVTLLSEAACKCEKQLFRSLLSASSSSMDKTHHVKTYQVMQQGLSTEPFAELEVDPSVEIDVWVSYAEVYNEQIYDLLQFHPPRGLQRPKLHLGMSKGHAYIKGLTHVSVTSGEEAYQILQYGIHNLNYGTSRSHSIFTIKLVQVSKSDGGSYVSSFNFCDLAGSEKSRKKQNVSERLKESNNINSSLLVLGRCIAAVRNIHKQKDQKLVPFRDSKLTQLFQRALTGFEDLAMIVNISHSREMFDETQYVLNFAAIAKDVILEQKTEPIFKKKNRFSQLVEKTSDNSSYNTESVEDLRYALRHMQEELENQRNEYKVTNQESIGHVIACYHRFFEQTEEETKKRIKKAENRVRIMYEAKLDIMIAKYEGIIEELAEGKNDVIEIISSDEEDQEQLWKHEKQNYERENIQLRNTLAEGIEDYKVLHEKYTQLLKENALLRGKCLELENEIDLGLEVKQEITEAECSDNSEKNFNYNESVIN